MDFKFKAMDCRLCANKANCSDYEDPTMNPELLSKACSEFKPMAPEIKTNGDRIRAMNDDELAEFIMLSPEMEFGVCECCEVFRGHGAYTPCGTENGWCTAELRCSAFKKWLHQLVEDE